MVSTPPPATASNQAQNQTQNQAKTGDNQAKKKMHMTDSQHAVVRLHPGTQLETAFRVHLMTETLAESNLKTGDICEISSDDGTMGYGIAWRADDRAGNRPKTRPAKMTETFKNAFGFLDGSRVTVAQTDVKVYPAERMILTDVTPSEFVTSDDMDAGKWETRIRSLFVGCEALAPGISFEVSGSRVKSKKRFYIDSIESRQAPVDSPSLFSYESSTDFTFPGGITIASTEVRPHSRQNGVSNATNGTSNSIITNGANGMRSVTPSPAPVHAPYQLNVERIGGLLEQCRELNRHLQLLLATAEELNGHWNLVPNHPILLHGYEGTGKTLLLKRLAEAPFRKVFRIDRANLPGGTISANKKFIRDTFAGAANEQPALVLLDDLDQIVNTDDTHYADILETELQNIMKPGKRVMVVASCKSPSNVHPSLLGPYGLPVEIELPIPNLEAREQILNVLQSKPAFAKNTLSTVVAERTHGYTAKDVVKAHSLAVFYGYRRYQEECAERAMGRSPTPPAYDDIMPRLDGSTATPSCTDSQPSPEPTLKDFEIALKRIKPAALREIFTEKPTTKWTDIGGSESTKARFDQAIEWPLRHKRLIEKMGVSMPKGVLLYGPPGCSKTLTAQAVANTYNLNFIAIKGAELLSMYVGESERAVREVFRKARQAAPCVIFFDEIDAIGSERDNSGTKGLNVLTTLLNEMDGFETLKDVFILAATNKPASLDPALLRPGRFDSHVYLGPPNEVARKEIIMLNTRGATLAKDVNFDHLAAELEGWSGAEIVRICQEAKMPAFKRAMKGEEDTRVTAADFAAARAGVRKGITAEMLAEFEAFTL